MNPINVEAFLSIAENRTISKAAEKLYLSQSTVSNRLRLLEEELRCELVNRGQGKRHSALTVKGEAFLPIAQRWQMLEHDILVFKESEECPAINVGNVESMGLFFFDELYGRIFDDDVPVKLFQSQHNNEFLYQAMSSNALDIAFTTESFQCKNIITKAIFSENMVLVSSELLGLPPGPIHPQQLQVSEEFQFNWKSKEQNMWHDRWWNPGEVPYIKTNSPSFAFHFITNKKCWLVVPVSMGKRMEQKEGFEIHDLIDSPPPRICYKIKPRYPHYIYPEAVSYFEKQLDEFLQLHPWIDQARTLTEIL